MHKVFYDVNQKYGKLWLQTEFGSCHARKYVQRWLIAGSIARIGPNDLITSDPALIKRMSAARSPYRRSEYYIGLRFDPSRDNIVSTRDENKHNELRSKMAAGVSSFYWFVRFKQC